VRSGDYRVNFRDGNETPAYYTDSLEDAVNTEMARNRALCEPTQRSSWACWRMQTEGELHD
jgi:hypothetical protein